MSEKKIETKTTDSKKTRPSTSFLKKTAKFFKDCKGELKKIVWPTKETVFKNMGVVLVTIIVLGVFIFLLDTVFMQLLGLVMDTAA